MLGHVYIKSLSRTLAQNAVTKERGRELGPDATDKT